MKYFRITEFKWMLAVTAVCVLGFISLNRNVNRQLKSVDYDSADYNAVNLSKNFDTDRLAQLLLVNAYVQDTQDAQLIARHISEKLKAGKTLPNLGSLNKSHFLLPAAMVDSLGGSGLKLRAETSRRNIGVDSVFLTMDRENLGNVADCGNGDSQITATVTDRDKNPVENVAVRLTEHYYGFNNIDESGQVIDSTIVAKDSILAYAVTDNKGVALFRGLNGQAYYSVIPIRAGFEYGVPKGTRKGSLANSASNYSFLQREHNIRLFDPQTYKNIKEDAALTVRTPADYRHDLTSYLVWLLIVWWALHFLLTVRKKEVDQLLAPTLMALTGLCYMIMNSIHNPLTDTMLGNDIAIGIIIGIALIYIASEFDFVKFYNNNYKFSFDLSKKLPKGSLYLIGALVLTFALMICGTGPEGSGVKVNLFFFQPSEISKYLIIVFLAAFFAANAEKIKTYSDTLKLHSLWYQFKTIIPIVISLLLLLGIYLVLGDMGPALVLAITFILIYSMARRDLPQMLLGLATFVVLLWLGTKLHAGLAFFALWLFLWLAYGYLRKKQVFESALFINLVIVMFVFGPDLLNVVGMDSAAERFEERNEMWSNPWENELPGRGDQVAQGLWGIATGGFFGQGLGEGNPNFVPAFHTDMIFTSVGEELGWLGLLAIIACLAILLRRSLLIGRKTGQPFAFYLAAGIAIVTGVQFLIITCGSTGLIPLTGIAVPFLSHGMTSMIINLAAFGVVLSLSKRKATDRQKEDIKKYDDVVAVGGISYMLASLLLLGTLFYYQVLARNSVLIRPAYVSTAQGERIAEYNPRINLLIKKMYAGNIYDRNGLVLATNEKNLIKTQDYTNAGVDGATLAESMRKRTQRYYPFGNHLFFMTGDYNTKTLWSFRENNPVGYLAESQHLAALRGFDNLKRDKETGEIIKKDLESKKYHETPFLNETSKSYTYTEYDYSCLLPGLKQGANGSFVKQHNENRADRDITLTVDAALQTRLQNNIVEYVANSQTLRGLGKLRVSVVAINAQNGDLLCSANYPLPDEQTIREKMNVSGFKFYRDNESNYRAWTDCDLGLTFQTAPGSTAKVMSALAGLQKYGAAASRIDYRIDEREVIEPPKNEPNFQRDGHNTTMREAIVESSNCYFINLVNDRDLYTQLDSIYEATGVRVENTTPYFFRHEMPEARRTKFRSEISKTRQQALNTYNNYIRRREVARNRESAMRKMNWAETQWAWGQGTMSATPLNMAKVAGIVANNGNMVDTRFILQGNKFIETPRQQPFIPIVSAIEANILRDYMVEQARVKGRFSNPTMGGKTGTPERNWSYKVTPYRAYNRTTKQYETRTTRTAKLNDGWYIFFVRSEKLNAPVAVAVRLERLPLGIGSRQAMLLSNLVLNTLFDNGYMNLNIN
ncbi:MAG: FtsW/RodA/SpoVE family cell cycle protein [Dysgonamonadaceae bacterium]|jgi:cell division protein FtsW (lipid II flippase)/cell division protein FtsI/penicillin-binding protein 2|nr:FtsW/RodA/SpoVE family cell cycle protein [Dysgonamonadaceae bacterium]